MQLKRFYKKCKWTINFTRKWCHLFLTWELSCRGFKKSESGKLNQHLFHPSQEKLLNIISIAHLKKETEKTEKFFVKLAKRAQSDKMTMFRSKANHFPVSLPNRNIFNFEVATDLMKLNNKTDIIVVDMQINVLAVIKNESI